MKLCSSALTLCIVSRALSGMVKMRQSNKYVSFFLATIHEQSLIIVYLRDETPSGMEGHFQRTGKDYKGVVVFFPGSLLLKFLPICKLMTSSSPLTPGYHFFPFPFATLKPFLVLENLHCASILLVATCWMTVGRWIISWGTSHQVLPSMSRTEYLNFQVSF